MRLHRHLKDHGRVSISLRNPWLNTMTNAPKQEGLHFLNSRGQKVYLTETQVERYLAGDRKYLHSLNTLGRLPLLDDRRE